MKGIIRLYSDKPGEIFHFLNDFYKKIVRKQNQRSESHECNALRAGESRKINLVFYGNKNNHSASEAELLWQNDYENPLNMADMIGVYIENNDKYKINMWISIDKDLYINITPHNADDVIRYLYERFPY